jgi:hypothetical protein
MKPQKSKKLGSIQNFQQRENQPLEPCSTNTGGIMAVDYWATERNGITVKSICDVLRA